MISTAKRAAETCLLALALTGCAEPAPAERRLNGRIVVFSCYTSSNVEIVVDGQPLELLPAAQRDDSVALCYDRPAELGSRVEVRVRKAGETRRFEVAMSEQTSFLHIMVEREPSAQAASAFPLLD